MIEIAAAAWCSNRRYFCVLCLVVAGSLNQHKCFADQLAFTLPSPVSGQVVEISSGGENAVTIVCFLGTECPMAKSYVQKLNTLSSEYKSLKVQLVGVFSNRQDSADDIRQYADLLGAEFDIVHDRENKVADQFGATRTPEVFVLDGELKLRYHGRIDDQYAPGVARSSATRDDLRIAIDELLAGKVVSVKQTRALGCLIGKIKKVAEQASPSITYHRDVLPVLQRNCIECHRSGEIAPFAMDSYDEVVGWADTMLEVVENGRMPPWHADPSIGEFANARTMPESDTQLLRDWIDLGAVEGDASDAPPPPSYLEKWQLSAPPDLVVPMRDRPFVVPKDGVVEYQYYVADLGLEEDRWVSAAQVIPGNHAVVHHAIVFIRPPDGSDFRGIGWLTAYVPGQRFHPFPEGTARFVPAGSKLVFQMHYTPIGSEESDLTQVGLVFADDAFVTDEVYTVMGINQDFEIPPDAANHAVEADVRGLPEVGKLLAVTPHMHYRGKSFDLFADFDSAEATALLKVPAYDFNWQHTYVLTNPIELEQLDRMWFNATFDNSKNNLFNPDPTEYVTWGDQTWEEMAVSFFEVSQPRGSKRTRRQSNASNETASSSREQQIQQYIENALVQMDKNHDGKIDFSETGVLSRRLNNFAKWDLDFNNVIERTELRQFAELLFPESK